MGKRLATSPKTTVLGTWTAMVILQLTLALLCSSAYPYSDDWSLVPAITGEENAGIGWLFAGHNEHRLPLVKLIHLVLLRATDFKYPVVAAFNVVLIATAAMALILAVKRWRGTWRRADALIPLLVLSPLLPIARWSFSTHFCLVLLGVCLLLSTRLVDRPKQTNRTDLLLATAALTLLLTAGLQGALAAGVVGIVLLVASVRGHVAQMKTTMTLASLTIASAIVLFLTRPQEGGVHDNATAGSTLAALIHLITDGISPLFAALPVPLGLLTIAVTAFVTKSAWPKPGSQRVAFTTALVAAAATAAAIAVSRSGSGWNAGVTLGYSLLILPIGLVVTLCWLTSSNTRARKTVAATIAFGAVSVAVGTAISIQDGIDNARESRLVSQQLDANGTSEQIARDHIGYFYFDESESRIREVADKLEILRNR